MSNATAIEKKIEALQADELIATDEGTHGGPKTIKIFERLDGTRYGSVYLGGTYHTSCSADADSEDGRMRHLTYIPAGQRKKEIADLQKQLAEIAKAESTTANRKADLERGWDGYQFVGVEKGREIASQMK